MVLQQVPITLLLLSVLLCHCPAYVVALQWYNISRATERGALCNDFSPAGFFLHKNPASSKWVIYLEGGGGCSTPRSCNERFIDQSIREQYVYKANGSRRVDVGKAWNDYSDRPLEVTSKLMTSLWCFSNASSNWTVSGTDILSTDPAENPTFHSHNHIVIPYCSSDLWLMKSKNYLLIQDSNFRFEFNPTSQEQQFTFRGVAILQSVIEDLFEMHGLKNATEVVFSGSSAGGVGVLNHAKWLQEKLDNQAPGCRLVAMLDSAWFINFKDGIGSLFTVEEIQRLRKSEEILESCSQNPAMCISAPSILSDQTLYPNIPTLAIFSLYDLYLLVDSLQNSVEDPQVIDIIRIVSEYSGSMNTSLQTANENYNNLSYYVTSCFQHVYFATSTLWGGEDSLFGDAAVDGIQENNQFKHVIQSGVWNTFPLIHFNETSAQNITIAEAIQNWLLAAENGETVEYQDGCSGPHCNCHCPEMIVLGQTRPYWDENVQAIISIIVVFISLVSAAIKLMLFGYARNVKYRQKRFNEWKEYGCYQEQESVLPYCQDFEAVSVACLNLRYSVSLSKSALRNAHTPAERKRLLSIAAGEEMAVGSDYSYRQLGRLDSQTGQCGNEEMDIVASIRKFQEQYRQKQVRRRAKFCRPLSEIHWMCKKRKKEIIRGISTYFNPGELTAIMGPSGSGKTTFLDLLAGRRNSDGYQGEIFVNGIPVDEVRDWYIANTGYMLQLATPYYEELTVRENLTLAAQMRLPKSFSLDDKFERIEQVMKEIGLNSLANTTVGGSTGPGLSGGQKRRLCVAMQLLSMPSLIFLDEPTSGLDATSSLELLAHLHRVASSNRAVILTIHQPRLEIFHMFDKIILLCQGQVAYHGIPDKAYEVFLEAYRNGSLQRSSRIANIESGNPADVIMDMLGTEEARTAILNFYQHTCEPQAVENAIENCRSSISSANKSIIRESISQGAGFLSRLAALESRAVRRANLGQTLYLPLIFITYGILLGTVYLQTNSATLILSGFGVFSCASALFMFPIIYGYLFRAMEIFALEYSDGVGNPSELIGQTFIRYATLSMLPIVLCSLTLYLLAIPHAQYNFWVFFQVTLFSLALNHTWIALLMFVIAVQPSYAHRISPVLSAIAGFAGGFFVPPRLMPPWYKWLFYANPNYYGFSAMARVLLQDINLGCVYDSVIECYPSTGAYILSYFSLNTVNPYLHITALLAMTGSFLLLSWLALASKHSYIIPRIRRLLKSRTKKLSSDTEYPASPIPSGFPSEDDLVHAVATEGQPGESSTELAQLRATSSDTIHLSVPASPRSMHEFRTCQRRSTCSRLLQDGENHTVWKPGMRQSVRTNGSQESLVNRRRTLLERINTYHSGSSTTLEEEKRRQPKGKQYLHTRANIEKRLEQWRKIEEEAMQSNKLEAFGSSQTIASVVSTPDSICVPSAVKLSLSEVHNKMITSETSPSETSLDFCCSFKSLPSALNTPLSFTAPSQMHDISPTSMTPPSLTPALNPSNTSPTTKSQSPPPPIAISITPAPMNGARHRFIFPDNPSSQAIRNALQASEGNASTTTMRGNFSLLMSREQRGGSTSIPEMDTILEEDGELSPDQNNSCPELTETTSGVFISTSSISFEAMSSEMVADKCRMEGKGSVPSEERIHKEVEHDQNNPTRCPVDTSKGPPPESTVFTQQSGLEESSCDHKSTTPIELRNPATTMPTVGEASHIYTIEEAYRDATNYDSSPATSPAEHYKVHVPVSSVLLPLTPKPIPLLGASGSPKLSEERNSPALIYVDRSFAKGATASHKIRPLPTQTQYMQTDI